MRLFRPLARRPVALLWAGLATSAIGDQVYRVAIAWIGVQAFGSEAGWLNALGAACVLVTALFGGRWADGWEPAGSMIGADLIRAAALLLVVAVWASGAPLWMWAAALVMAIVVLGVGQGVFRPALQDVMPAAVADRAMLPAANALFDTTERIARLLGPGLIGVLASVLAPVMFLVIDAASFLASAAAVAAIRVGLPRLDAPPGRAPIWSSLLRGFRAVRVNRVLSWQLMTTGPLNGAWTATFLLAVPLMVERHGLTLGGDTGFGAYGAVILGYGSTNLVTNLIVGNRDMPRRPARHIAAANLILGTGTLLLGLTEWLELTPGMRLGSYLACAALAAIGGPLQDIPVAVLRQTALPRAEVPATMRAFMAMAQGGILFALGIAPALLWAMPIGVFVVLCGLVTLAIGAGNLARERGAITSGGLA